MTEATPRRRVTDRTDPRSWPRKALGYLLIGLSVASVIIVAVQTIRLNDASARLNDVTSCQAEYNQSYTSAIKGRSEAARQERQAQRKLLTTLLGMHVTEAQGRAAFDEYLKALDKSDDARDRAALPTQKC